MTRRWRTQRYGAAILVVLAGAACAATISGTLGGTLATVLIGVGLVGVLSLVFYEVGLSEDRERARRRSRDERQRPAAPAHPDTRPRPAPRRPDRMRGHRRRLR